MRRLFQWFAGIGNDPTLALAQAEQLRRQIPLLYGLLLINSLAIAITHAGLAPPLLTFSVPAVLFGATLARLVYWSRSRPIVDPARAQRLLRTLTVLAAVFGTAYVIWSSMLSRYGGIYERAHVALYVSTTVIGCIFCLTPLPQAAVVVAVCVLPAFWIDVLDQQHWAFAPITVNVLLVLAVLMRVLFNAFGSFRSEIGARQELARQHAELVRLNEANRQIAMTDSLTQLANRRRFYADLNSAIDGGARVGQMSVGIIDLDRFKPVNDTFGHHVGDELLAEVASRLQTTAGAQAAIYRLGGDEFAMITRIDPHASEILAQRLCDAVALPVRLGDRQMSVGASIGLASLTEADTSARALAERADHALYHAKRQRPGTIVTFTPELEKAVRDEQAIEVELQACVLDDELDIHVQPIVDARTGQMIGGEVLARWDSPRLGPVSPTAFITIAERSSLIHRITLVIVRRALALLGRLPDTISLSVNISACDLTSRATMAAIVDAVARSGVDPARLWIEVTETAVMRDTEAAIQALRGLRANGIKIALDDFGTGQSSLSNLHRLPLDKVKLDRSFINDLDDPGSRSIAMSVVELCRTLDLLCVAEGVETARQLATLRAMGCTLIQGYLFSPPRPVGQFLAAATRSDRDRAAIAG